MTVNAETLRLWLEAGTPLSIVDVRPDAGTPCFHWKAG
jgi:hypothetical protein